MKRAIVILAGAVFIGGCASENHRVETRNGGRHYGFDDQAHTATAGEGTLMRGSSDARQIPTGQFTGRERTLDQIGQFPTLPGEAQPRELRHD